MVVNTVRGFLKCSHLGIADGNVNVGPADSLKWPQTHKLHGGKASKQLNWVAVRRTICSAKTSRGCLILQICNAKPSGLSCSELLYYSIVKKNLYFAVNMKLDKILLQRHNVHWNMRISGKKKHRSHCVVHNYGLLRGNTKEAIAPSPDIGHCMRSNPRKG